MATVIRKHFTAVDQPRFVAALKRMRATTVTGQPYSNVYDKYLYWHREGGFNNVAHGGLAFIAWHRVFLWEFEEDLIAADTANGKNGAIAIPYWNWTRDISPNPVDATGKIWVTTFMGGNGDPADGNKVKDGPFQEADWPTGPLVTGINGQPNHLRRTLGAGGALATSSIVSTMLGLARCDSSDFRRGAASDSFRNRLEGFSNDLIGSRIPTHNQAHNWIGGNMGNVNTSPIEPAFWLNHSYVDRLWYAWQIRHLNAPHWPGDSDLENERQATATSTVNAGGTITSCTITHSGGGYLASAPPAVSFNGGGGTGATATAQIGLSGTPEVGKVTAITLTSGGSGYLVSPGPAVTIDPPRGPLVKRNEALIPWDGTNGTRIWTPGNVLRLSSIGPVGTHKYRYDRLP